MHINLSADKRYYSIGEVAKAFGVNASLIRFWDSEFDILKPKKNAKGNRMFTPEDVKNLQLIYHLVKEISGAEKFMWIFGLIFINSLTSLVYLLSARKRII